MRLISKLRHSRTLLSCLLTALVVAACGGVVAASADPQQITENKVHQLRNSLPPGYVPPISMDYNNYMRAQKLYAQPDTILWCTTTWGNPSAPMVTIPVAGKLTSSSVSYLPQDFIDTESGNATLRQAFSNDGMYHGDPPPYRYGFTPGGQYVDFFNMPTLCTTAMTQFQRQQTNIALTIDPTAEQATQQAEAALKAGTDAQGNISPAAEAHAQQILQGAGLNGK